MPQIKRTDGSWGPFSFGIGKFTGATTGKAGTSGTVPAPAAGDQEKFLKGDGSWASAADTKVTNTLATATKAYITGTTSSSSNTGTQVFDTGVYLDTTAGTLVAKTFKTSTGIEIY